MAAPDRISLVRLELFEQHAELLNSAEWTLIAWYCWMGAETYADTARTRISNESIIGILRAFLAVYDLRKAKQTPEDAFYLSNLPSREREQAGSIREAGKDEVRRAIQETIKSLEDRRPGQPRPIQAVKNLYHLLVWRGAPCVVPPVFALINRP